MADAGDALALGAADLPSTPGSSGKSLSVKDDALSGGGSLESLRRANRLRVVDALRREGSASRSDLMRITGLSRTTITTLLSDLQERGMVVAREPEQRA